MFRRFFVFFSSRFEKFFLLYFTLIWGLMELQTSKEILKKIKDKGQSHESVLEVFRTIYLTRLLDQKMFTLLRQNKGGSFFLSVAGHELIGAVAASCLTPGKDWAFPYHRDRALVVGLGSTPIEILASFLAKDCQAHSSGRMMPEHFSHKKLRIPCQSSCVGSQMLQAVGMAKAVLLSGSDEVVYVSIGDGATSQGDFHEMLNFSLLHKLPLVIVVQDNGYAISVTREEQTAGGNIAKTASGYPGLNIFEVDGSDFEMSMSTMKEAFAKARMKTPSLVVAKVVRLNSHSGSDDQTKYKDIALIEEEKKKDPLVLLESYLLQKKIITGDELELFKEELKNEVDEAAIEANALPSINKEDASKMVFLPCEIGEVKSDSIEERPKVTMVEALNSALHEEFERDAEIVLFGEDVADKKGGVFGVTKGLSLKFGKERCFNTPLAESTIVGVAIGMGMSGRWKPVIEIQYVDYFWSGANQLLNEMPSIFYRSNGMWNCPVVVRMPYGGYIQGGPYHSQSPEAIFCHIPGVKVVVPSNAYDAKCLLKAAIRDPNPVIFLEHKALYRQRKFMSPMPLKEEIMPLGKAFVAKEGSDITLLCYGLFVPMGCEVALELEKAGISVEVVDLRTLSPLDMETILRSVKKTNKVIIAHEASKSCGFGAELVARIYEEAYNLLDAPIIRLAGKDCPMPYAKDLEDAVLPQRADLEKNIKMLFNF